MFKFIIKPLVYNILQFFGIYIYIYSSFDQLLNIIKNESKSVQEFELGRIAHQLSNARSHIKYDSFLRTFIPNWDLEYNKAHFIGSGLGRSNVNVFRKVQINDSIYHEKVFYSFHEDLARLLWLQNNVIDIIEEADIKTSKVQMLFTSNFLTSVYSDFLVISPLSNEEIEKCIVEFSIRLYVASIGEKFENIKNKIPNNFRDFTQHFQYSYNIENGKEKLLEKGVDVNRILSKIEDSRYVLTHGDIQSTNAFQNSILIDWDAFGIYPIGLDPAFSYFKLVLNNNTNEDTEAWLIDNYQNIILKDEWESFELNFYFFCYIFMFNHFEQNRIPLLENRILEFLK